MMRKVLEYVYLIWASETDWYKIGLTTNPKARIEKLQTGTPTTLVFVGLMEIESAAVIEKFLLEKWKKRSAYTRGEWFKFYPQDMPDVFSDFRVDLDKPVEIPSKPLPIKRTIQKSRPAYIPSEEALQLFPGAPYDIDKDTEEAIKAIEVASNMGFSEAWMLRDLFGGILPGGSKQYQNFKAAVDIAKTLSAQSKP